MEKRVSCEGSYRQGDEELGEVGVEGQLHQGHHHQPQHPAHGDHQKRP